MIGNYPRTVDMVGRYRFLTVSNGLLIGLTVPPKGLSRPRKNRPLN